MATVTIVYVVNMGDWTRVRMWALAVAVAVLGFNLMVGLGWIEARRSIYAGPRLLWLCSFVGGALFGFGMVLALGVQQQEPGACGRRQSDGAGHRACDGRRGVCDHAGDHPAVLRVNTVEQALLELPTGQDLPSFWSAGLGVATRTLALVLGTAVALLLMMIWVLRKPERRSIEVWLGSAGIGVVIAATWWVSGHQGFAPEDPNTL
jgi:hypothetical protein